MTVLAVVERVALVRRSLAVDVAIVTSTGEKRTVRLEADWRDAWPVAIVSDGHAVPTIWRDDQILIENGRIVGLFRPGPPASATWGRLKPENKPVPPPTPKRDTRYMLYGNWGDD